MWIRNTVARELLINESYAAQAYLADRQQVRPALPAVPVQQGVVTDKQRAATGPFLAYVNLCKPLLLVRF
jgi:hypothetical protein